MYPVPQVPEVPAEQVPADAVLLDVREDDEWAAGRPALSSGSRSTAWPR
jgi:rhodanese-related sulfurtransferase